MDRPTDGQTDRQTDSWTDRWTGRDWHLESSYVCRHRDAGEESSERRHSWVPLHTLELRPMQPP